MKATLLVRVRIVYAENAFAETVLSKVPMLIEGSAHCHRYRLAYVVDGKCEVRYDNEAVKGDHRRYGGRETPYTFTTPEKLIADFQRDIRRWNDENRDA